MLHDRTRLKKLKTASYQIIIILAVWSCADVLQKLLNLPVASGVLGFFLLLFLLEMKWLKLAHVERGANLLLAELLLFFIPPVVGVIQYQDLFNQRLQSVKAALDNINMVFKASLSDYNKTQLNGFKKELERSNVRLNQNIVRACSKYHSSTLTTTPEKSAPHF